MEGQREALEYHGMVNIDRDFVQQLLDYHKERVSLLSLSLQNSIHPLPGFSFPPSLQPASDAYHDVDEALENLSKKMKALAATEKPSVPADDWEEACKNCNEAFWEYVEMVEESSKELYQQLNHVSLENWDDALKENVTQINDLLLNALRKTAKDLDTTDNLIKEYRRLSQKSAEKKRWQTLLPSTWRRLLDKALWKHLDKTERFLLAQNQSFNYHYDTVKQLQQSVSQSMQKFDSFELFASLDPSFQSDYQRIYSLLKLWELNKKVKALPGKTFVQALRHSYPIEKVYKLFHHYYLALKERLYERSRTIKTTPKLLFADPTGRSFILDTLAGYRVELHSLANQVKKYHDFFFKTAPNPDKARKFTELSFDIDTLDRQYKAFSSSFSKGPSEEQKSQLQATEKQIGKQIHEMAQPLASPNAFLAGATKVLTLLNDVDELGSFGPSAIDYSKAVLCKLLRLDSKRHMLLSTTSFKAAYDLHQNIVGVQEEKNHLKKLERFDKLTKHLLSLAEKEEVFKSEHEVELDLNDLKGYLQDFFAAIQRASQDESMGKRKSKQFYEDSMQFLLEYRMLFAQFFNQLKKYFEGKVLLPQLYFIERYFESIETKLAQIKAAKQIA